MSNSSITSKEWKFRALTDIWTGDFHGKPNRLIATGLLGSIRWWYEVLVRGLDGHACDPSETKCEDKKHCVVCELFGCTGWSRKFRFEVLNKNGNMREVVNNAETKISPQIKQDEEFSLRFTPLRPIRSEEWALLDVTLRLIAEYGAIGGKMVFKPTDESSRESKLHHKDYGLVQMVSPRQFNGKDRSDLKTYLSKFHKLNHGEFAWASLQHFWCVNGKYLRRINNNKSTFNQVLGRKEATNQGQQLAAHKNEIAGWLAGSQQESKKVFSFKNPPRTFGFVKPGLIDFNTIEQRLSDAWGKNGWIFLTGDKIIDRLFTDKGRRS